MRMVLGEATCERASQMAEANMQMTTVDGEFLLCGVSMKKTLGTPARGKLHYFKVWPLFIFLLQRGSRLIKDGLE